MKDQPGPMSHSGASAEDPFAELIRLVEEPAGQKPGGRRTEAFRGFEAAEVRAAEWDDFTYDADEPGETAAFGEEPDDLDEFENELAAELGDLTEPAERNAPSRAPAAALPAAGSGARSGEIALRGSSVDGRPTPIVYAAFNDDGKASSSSGIENALRGLSQPARPRDHVPVVTQSFAPDREHDHHPVQATTITLDDFDELIASELAAMQPAVDRRAHAPLSLEPAFMEGEDALGDGEREHAARRRAARFEDEDYEAPLRIRRGRSVLLRTLLLGGSVAATALVGAFAYSAWQGTVGPAVVSDEPLLIKADMTPVKVLPVDPGGKTIPNQNKAVYERVASNEPLPPPAQQTLMQDSEEPLDLSWSENEASNDLPGVSMTGTSSSLVGAMVGEPEDLAALERDDPMALEPRKVRTLVVRPDGTLESQDVVVDPAATDAASKAQPASASQTTEVAVSSVGAMLDPVAGIAPAAPFSVDLLSAETVIDPLLEAQAPQADAPAEPAVAPAAPPAAVTAAAEPEVVASLQPLPEIAPAPEVSVPQPEVPAPAPVAAEPPAAADAPVAVSALPAGGYFVQISSQPSEALARKSLATLSGRYGSAIGDRATGIQSAEIAGKGTYYRVRIAAASKGEANTVCAKIQSAGGSCFVTR